MASKATKGGASAPLAPMQPGLRSFIIYDHVPAGCFSFIVRDDDCAPHVRTGETVIIDPREREPMKGDLFMIQWTSGRQRKVIAQVKPTPDWMVMLDKEHKPDPQPFWMISGTRAEPIVCLNGKPLIDDTTGEQMQIRWTDGPYDAAGIEQRMRGRVVGLLAVSFEEPKRLGPAVQ